MSTAPLVTVLIPVYNGEEYIRECVESVLAQTHTNWECIIVNNCSTDRTLEIIQEYAARDARIRIVNNAQFLRAVANHNVALGMVSLASKYTKMVFADDWLFPECLEKMVSLAEQHPAVGIVGSYRLLGDKLSLDGLPYNVEVLSGREICRAVLLGKLALFGTATSVLIRSDLVRGRSPFYNESNLHADTETCYELLKSCDFGFVHQVLTFTRTQEESLTTVSRGLRTYLAGFLSELVKFGPYYLETRECQAAVKEHLRIYYAFLGRSVFQGRDKKFWDYHRRRMSELGLPLSQVRVASAAVRRAVDVALGLNNWPYALVRRLGSLVRSEKKASPKESHVRERVVNH